MTATFDRIYRDNLWNGVESLSGPGSGPIATAHVSGQIVELAAELGVRSVLDVACGDGYWMPDLPGYVGIDVARAAVHAARQRHPDRHYRIGDIRRLRLAPADMVIVRDVIQHLSLDDGVEVIEAIRSGRHRWLLASTYIGGDNVDIETGDAYSPDLSAAPFDLGRPESVIFDGYTYHDPDAVRDPRKHLGLWALTHA